MRRLIYGMLTSLDLYVEGRDGSFDWATPDPELHRHFNTLGTSGTTHLYGRRLWEMMSGFWPTADADPDAPPEIREFARVWNAGEHIVFSRTLTSVEHGARLVTGDAVEAVRQLKAGDGPDMDVGGPDFASALIEAGLVDEIHAYVHPIAVGGGKPLLPGLRRELELTLLGVQTFGNGVVQLRYTPSYRRVTRRPC